MEIALKLVSLKFIYNIKGLITNYAIAERKHTTIDKLPEIPDEDPIW